MSFGRRSARPRPRAPDSADSVSGFVFSTICSNREDVLHQTTLTLIVILLIVAIVSWALPREITAQEMGVIAGGDGKTAQTQAAGRILSLVFYLQHIQE